MAIFSTTGPSDAQHRVQLRRALIAGTVGTITEAYDFLLYVQVAPLVFAKLYFPSSDPLVGTLQAFGIYAVGFISRPIGATLFGHYGDRVGAQGYPDRDGSPRPDRLRIFSRAVCPVELYH